MDDLKPKKESRHKSRQVSPAAFSPCTLNAVMLKALFVQSGREEFVDVSVCVGQRLVLHSRQLQLGNACTVANDLGLIRLAGHREFNAAVDAQFEAVAAA